MHSENNELVKAGHELAKCLDSEPLLDIAKMIVRLADKLDVTTLALREKTKQCEQLAAENAALKNYRPQPQGAAMMEALDAFFEHEDVPEQGMMNAFEILFCKRPETPATDAFIAEQRAQGVEMFAESQKAYVRDNRNSLDAMTRAAYCGSALDAERFAAQLRSKSEVQS
ncbi:hypothetical protein [Cronobacter malonaticus]|uniref:hypothetical protein n=1 Tax=Cronobacter malonaticus TaxID=413503 RepID=UPI0035188E53